MSISALPENTPQEQDPVFSPKKAEAPISIKSPRIALAKEQPTTMKKFIQQVADLEARCVDMRAEINGMNSKELREKVAELADCVEKKAATLELKKVNGTVEYVNQKCEDLAKSLADMKKSYKSVEDNDAFNQLRLKVGSLDNKMSVVVKNVKEVQTKLSENMCLQLTPQERESPEDDKVEARLDQFSREMGARLEKITQGLAESCGGAAKVGAEIDGKLEGKVGREEIVNLESM